VRFGHEHRGYISGTTSGHVTVDASLASAHDDDGAQTNTRRRR